MSGDLISRGMVIDLLNREIKNAKEMENQCEECYKNCFILKQVIYSSIKDFVMALPSFNDTLNSILKQLENLKESAERGNNYHFDRSSNYPCEYNITDLSERNYKTLCDVIEIVKSVGVSDD